MSIGNLNTQGDKKNNFAYQLGVMQLLETIATNTGAGTGADYELVNTDYEAIANGVGYSIGDSITRTLVLSVPTGTVITTIFWNNTTGLQILPAPPYSDLQQVAISTSVTVNNGAGVLAVNIQDGGNSITVDNANLDVALSTLNREVTQLLIQALLTTIDGDTSNLDVLLSTRASEATLLTLATEATLTTRATEATLATRASEATLATMLTLAGFEARINTLGQKTMANSTPVVLASDQASIPVTTDKSATSTNTAVARVTTVGGVVILAANAARKGATISNDSGAILYLKFAAIGGTSSTSFTVRLTANAYYEVPFQYTGDISGIWASAGAGNALVSELT